MAFFSKKHRLFSETMSFDEKNPLLDFRCGNHLWNNKYVLSVSIGTKPYSSVPIYHFDFLPINPHHFKLVDLENVQYVVKRKDGTYNNYVFNSFTRDVTRTRPSAMLNGGQFSVEYDYSPEAKEYVKNAGPSTSEGWVGEWGREPINLADTEWESVNDNAINVLNGRYGIYDTHVYVLSSDGVPILTKPGIMPFFYPYWVCEQKKNYLQNCYVSPAGGYAYSPQLSVVYDLRCNLVKQFSRNEDDKRATLEHCNGQFLALFTGAYRNNINAVESASAVYLYGFAGTSEIDLSNHTCFLVEVWASFFGYPVLQGYRWSYMFDDVYSVFPTIRKNDPVDPPLPIDPPLPTVFDVFIGYAGTLLETLSVTEPEAICRTDIRGDYLIFYCGHSGEIGDGRAIVYYRTSRMADFRITTEWHSGVMPGVSSEYTLHVYGDYLLYIYNDGNEKKADIYYQGVLARKGFSLHGDYGGFANGELFREHGKFLAIATRDEFDTGHSDVQHLLTVTVFVEGHASDREVHVNALAASMTTPFTTVAYENGIVITDHLHGHSFLFRDHGSYHETGHEYSTTNVIVSGDILGIVTQLNDTESRLELFSPRSHDSESSEGYCTDTIITDRTYLQVDCLGFTETYNQLIRGYMEHPYFLPFQGGAAFINTKDEIVAVTGNAKTKFNSSFQRISP